MSDLSDRIEVRGWQALLFCGVLAEEQARRQPFLFDLDIYLDLASAGSTDDLTKTADYGGLVDRLGETLEAERFQLLERMAARTAELVLEVPVVDSVTVTIRKLRPPVAAHLGSTGVRIHRPRS